MKFIIGALIYIAVIAFLAMFMGFCTSEDGEDGDK